jgi:hypothetical protein
MLRTKTDSAPRPAPKAWLAAVTTSPELGAWEEKPWEGGAFLLEEFDLPLFLLGQRIDPRRLSVEEGGDGVLLWQRWDGNRQTHHFAGIDRRVTHTNGISHNRINEIWCS